MRFEDYTVVVHQQEDGWWVADIPALPACYALMPTRDEALKELSGVFAMVEEEYQETGRPLPADTTQIVHA